MPARPVAVRHGERSAQGVCFSCRGHAAVPISSGLVWLLMSGSMSGLRRAGREGTARGRKVRRCFGRCFAAGVRRIGASWFVSGWEALRGQIWPICPPVIVARAKGSRSV
jgi:hypothetical protein